MFQSSPNRKFQRTKVMGLNQVRFNIGVPKSGSAARLAEESAGSPLGTVRPRAGSAARDAEERKRMEPGATHRGAAIGLRAQGGRAVTAEEMRAASARPWATSQPVTDVPQAVIEHIDSLGQHPVPVAANRTTYISAAGVSEQGISKQVVGENASSGPLQTAAVRIKSLVQSLFSLGDSSSKP